MARTRRCSDCSRFSGKDLLKKSKCVIGKKTSFTCSWLRFVTVTVTEFVATVLAYANCVITLIEPSFVMNKTRPVIVVGL